LKKTVWSEKEIAIMLKERHGNEVQRTPCSSNRQETFQAQTVVPRQKTFVTGAGKLTLQTQCSPSLVESLRADEGLRAFARLPEREHQLLIDIARNPDSILTLAYTDAGEIVGQVTLAPCEEWWQGIPNMREIGLEVSYRWRRMSIAQQLLAFAFELDALEEIILLGMGLSWHWDIMRSGVHPFRYRELIAQTLQPHGFFEYQTSEPNIVAEPANILLARIGSHVDSENVNQFFHRLLDTDVLLK
jgi:acetoin utilization protein AcuA